MIFAGLIISAVAVLLGVFTKLPQGGGGLANNLMAMSLFYLSPPLLPPPPPPRAIIFDLDSAVLDTRHCYISNPLSTGNITEGPMPSPLATPRAGAGSRNPPAPNSSFSLPGFSFPAFSPLLHFNQLWITIGEIVAKIAMAFFALCLPWLAARQMYLLDLTISVRKAADTPLLVATGLKHELCQIHPHNFHFGDIEIAISEHDEALVELMRITMEVKNEKKKALEKEYQMEEDLKRLRKERDDALVEFSRGKRNLEKLRKEKGDEAKGLRQETTKQAGAWEEKEKEWEEKRAADAKRNQEENNSLKMGREWERHSWKKQVERLEMEKKREKEGMGRKLKDISERFKKEKEEWAKEREVWKKEKEEESRDKESLEAERKNLEQDICEEKQSCKEANDRAKGRIVELESENEALRNEAAEKEKLEEERKATRQNSDEARAEEQKRQEEGLQAEAQKAISKLEEEVLNGRKLIENLQGDKRRDRQLLLELRAQLVRPTHATPPTHINPLRFGGSAQTAMGGPANASSSAALDISPFASPRAALPPIRPSNPPTVPPSQTSPGKAVNQDVDLPTTPLPPRPVVRLPSQTPPRQMISAQLSAPTLPPTNAPKGPKGWTPGPSKGPHRSK